MMVLKIGIRNILRNRRRSAMTMSAISVGAIAILLFGGFMMFIILGYQTGVVQRTGHLTVFRDGYFNYGTGNPAAYGIDDYQSVTKLITGDPVVGPMIQVITPGVTLFGIAGNFDIDASKTFFGSGVIPSERNEMRHWNDYHLTGPGRPLPDMRDDDPQRGVVGIGLARILGFCQKLKLDDCPPPPPIEKAVVADANPSVGADLANLAAENQDKGPADPHEGMPRIDLLAATAGGAPNVVSLYIAGTDLQGAKELDDAYVSMHLSLAQQLLYGRGTPKVTGIVLQLEHTAQMGPARARLNQIFHEHNLPLEVRDFTELTPQYNQVIGLFGSIFVFIAVIMGVIVLFTVVNTMSMSVMERTNEIGTSRAMGVRRSGIRIQFIVEGLLLGVVGATAGVILSFVLAEIVNNMGLTWMPPGQAARSPLRLLMSGVSALMIGTWIGLVIVAAIASLIPASRAAKMQVVDALRHV
jgi:putative ABC transport system permease protein